MTEIVEKHITVTEEGLTAIDCLTEQLSFSRQQLKQIMQNGALWLESARESKYASIVRLRRARKILRPGDQLHLYYNSSIQSAVIPAAELIADEGGYSIWNKPSGMLCQGSKWGDHCTIYRWAEKNLRPERPAFIVHRLDRAARGLIILAHKKKTAAAFSALFEARKIDKVYSLTAEGIMDNIQLPCRISHQLDGKPAISDILSIQNNLRENTCDIQIKIETGRKHQIRRQMADMGHPIVGDRLYGAKNIAQDLVLISQSQSFDCPLTGDRKNYSL